MELLFESRRNLTAYEGRLRFAQHHPRIHPQPVVMPDTFVDGAGAVIYGTVLHEDRRYRMWYQAVPKSHDHKADVASVALAESDDGIHWRKPELGLVECGPGRNHLTDLSLHAPAIFVDPASPAARKYTATGCIKPGHRLTTQGYTPGIYTAHSADGERWQLDRHPLWPFTGDVSSSVYHPGRGEAIVAVKYMPRRNGLVRRAISTATLSQGHASPASPALVPDESADMLALTQGYNSADYYGMGMMPGGGTSTVGFLWNYWHALPYSPGPTGNGPVALYGQADISLVYQEEAGALWQHMPGRPAFIHRHDIPWRAEWLYSASSPVLVGSEHRLYFTTSPYSHGRQLREDWKPDAQLVAELEYEGHGRIGMASWPRWRMFGLFADPHGAVTLKLGKLEKPCRLKLNFRCGKSGRVRVAVLNDDARSLDQCVDLTGDHVDAPVAWRGSGDGGDVIPAGDDVRLKLELHDATAYAWELIPTQD